MKEQLEAGLDSAMENSAKALLSTYEWKMPKKLDINGKYVQDTIKLVDATNEQLKSFQMHCLTMLNNTDPKYPGRKVLLKIIEDQQDKCNAELFFRSYGDIGLVNLIKSYLDENSLTDKVDTLKVSSIFDNVPSVYKDLSIETTLLAGEKKLGLYDRTYMTLTFILNKGINLSDTERDLYSDHTEEEIIDSVREQVGLQNTTIPIIFRTNTGLSISELGYLLPLKKQRYSDIPTDILTILRDKLLVYLKNDIKFHIAQWEERLSQIETVAKDRGFSL